jgi:aminoglycoside phosphotransferase (APT) family kinase protein
MGFFAPCYYLRGWALERFGVWLGGRIPDKELIRRFEEYLRAEMLPRLECPEARITPVGGGANPVVRRIEPADGTPLAARCFARRMGKEKSFEHVEVSNLLYAAGVDIPEFEYSDASRETVGRYGFDVVVEEWVEGRHPMPEDFVAEDAPLLDAAAALLGKMHAVTASAPGRPWEKRLAGAPFLDYFFTGREQGVLERLAGCDFLEVSAEQRRAVGEFLDRRRPALDPGPPYALVHGDFQCPNLVVRQAGEKAGGLALIDFGTVHYGLWPWDFVGFHVGAAGRDAAITRRLLERYLPLNPAASAEYFARAWPYLLAWHDLEKAAAAVRKHERALRKGAGRDPEAHRRSAAEHWRLALAAIDAPSL